MRYSKCCGEKVVNGKCTECGEKCKTLSKEQFKKSEPDLIEAKKQFKKKNTIHHSLPW